MGVMADLAAFEELAEPSACREPAGLDSRLARRVIPAATVALVVGAEKVATPAMVAVARAEPQSA